MRRFVNSERSVCSGLEDAKSGLSLVTKPLRAERRRRRRGKGLGVGVQVDVCLTIMYGEDNKGEMSGVGLAV